MRRNRLTAAVMAAVLAAGMIAGAPKAADAASNIKLIVDGEQAKTQAAPFIKNNRVYVPIRVVEEYYPISLKWNNQTKKLNLTSKDGSVYTLAAGSSVIRNGQAPYSTLTAPAVLHQGRLYVTLDAFNSLTGAGALLDKTRNVITIDSGDVTTTVRVPKEPIATAAGQANVKLYAALKNTSRYEGMILEVNGRRHTFDWKAPVFGSYPVQLYYSDVNGDGKREAVVIWTLGYGTGMYQDEVRVVNPEDWTVVKVAPAESEANRLVKSSAVQEGKDISITVNWQGKTPGQVKLIYPDRERNTVMDHLGFGGVVRYAVKNGKLAATAAGSIGNTEYVGDLTLRYGRGGQGLQATSTAFEAYPEYTDIPDK
ncbi:stalk domain-containing protein [Paenibacillus sp. JX-17]|uniref:Stalk domain-containing protein n=1 Tax=Paenibacillus lacisoli TaxID=3064525 RepID=A0ABT9CAS3_9BACL|nr:stalk domain-containing protein [Paenibacillus sp. JX-17]MDO7906366.1 stalk domain-containing protein [Paenibacillus sp. JX-17]